MVFHCSLLMPRQVSYRDAEALKRQDQLIAEEFEMQQIEESKAKVLAEKEKEKKAKKKVRGTGMPYSRVVVRPSCMNIIRLLFICVFRRRSRQRRKQTRPRRTPRT